MWLRFAFLYRETKRVTRADRIRIGLSKKADSTMTQTNPLDVGTQSGNVLIIEDDTSLRWMLSQTLKSHGFTPITFERPADFFEQLANINLRRTCLLLDMRLPGMSGLEVQERLEQGKINIPIIFMSGNSHISEAIAGLKNGAIDFLLKPFEEDKLIEVVKKTFASSASAPKANVFKLTTRELLVLDYVSKGWRSEQIAEALGLTVRTIKMHRSNIIHKTGSNTITEAALMVMHQKG